MSALADLRRYGRFALRLRTFLKHPITIEEARATVVRRVAEREASFLRVAERAIFGNPRSPYLPLFNRAGCAYGDLQAMVRTRGVEPTLRTLHESGVYVTLEEFKGRAPITRAGFITCWPTRRTACSVYRRRCGAACCPTPAA